MVEDVLSVHYVCMKAPNLCSPQASSSLPLGTQCLASKIIHYWAYICYVGWWQFVLCCVYMCDV